MDKILAEYRKKIGDFEVVEVDEARIEALRNQLDVDVPIDLHWTWNYGSEVEELRALYERGKRGQWNAEDDIERLSRRKKVAPARSWGRKPYRCHHAKAPAQGGKAGNDRLAAAVQKSV